VARNTYETDDTCPAGVTWVVNSAVAKARHPNGYGLIVAAALDKPSARGANDLAIRALSKFGRDKP
jgi:hypothetical protein